MRDSWLTLLVLAAVLCGSMGFHGLAHNFGDQHEEHAGQTEAAAEDCAVCALATSPLAFSPGEELLTPPTSIAVSYALLAHQWLESVSLSSRFDRGPPTLLS